MSGDISEGHNSKVILWRGLDDFIVNKDYYKMYRGASFTNTLATYFIMESFGRQMNWVR